MRGQVPHLFVIHRDDIEFQVRVRFGVDHGHRFPVRGPRCREKHPTVVDDTAGFAGRKVADQHILISLAAVVAGDQERSSVGRPRLPSELVANAWRLRLCRNPPTPGGNRIDLLVLITIAIGREGDCLPIRRPGDLPRRLIGKKRQLVRKSARAALPPDIELPGRIDHVRDLAPIRRERKRRLVSPDRRELLK